MNERDTEILRGLGLDPEAQEASVEAYEVGDLSGMAFGPVMRGRPRLSQSDELRPITVKVPASRIAALRSRAAERGISQSEWVREAIDEKLVAAV